MADDRMPKVEFSQSQNYVKNYVDRIEKQNIERVQKLLMTRRRNIITGILLAGGVIGIYAYSIAAVKQETFLDDFDEPVKGTAK